MNSSEQNSERPGLAKRIILGAMIGAILLAVIGSITIALRLTVI